MGCDVKVIEDSVNPYNGIRLTTVQLKYWRAIHSEFMTHRTFCLSGDSVLEFDLPSGDSKNPKHRRIFLMTIKEFVEKWYNGDSLGRDMKRKLLAMKIRQLNEDSNKICNCTIKDCICSGYKEVFEIKTSSGKTVKGSKDHRILTVDGWKIIDDLIVGKDFIITERYGIEEHHKKNAGRYKKIDGKWKSTWLNQIRIDKLQDQEYMCFDCGTSLRDLHDLHHIIPVCEDISKAFDYDNIVALCRYCHNQRHRVQGWQEGSYLYGYPELLVSVESKGIEETYDLEVASDYENFVANGIIVHNSRNASSSRAIPVKKIIKQVWDDPAGPSFWGANQTGMQAYEELSDFKRIFVQNMWKFSSRVACSLAWIANLAGPHKQILNRMLEPWQYISVIATGTEWDNFFDLRDHHAAQPEIRELAQKIKCEMSNSIPQECDYHLPYISSLERDMFNPEICMKLSTARCARVSYLTHDGKKPEFSKDMELYERLVGSTPIHASPTEHSAVAVESVDFIKNFRGWKQHRVDVENNLINSL